MKIDENTIAIIRHLRNGRKSFKKIAEALSLSENTVRTRVKKMLDRGILQITGLVDPEQIPRLRPVIIGVKLRTTDMFKKGREFKNLRGVVSVSVVTGRYDLMLLVLLTRDYGLQEFYAQEVSKIKDVRSLETFVIYKSYNLKVPFIH